MTQPSLKSKNNWLKIFLFLFFRLVQCEGILIVFGLWLGSVETEELCESVLIEKLLEILSRLTFTVDLLVKYKFGRVIKKITQQQTKTIKGRSVNYEMAVKLFEDWSVLANKPEMPTVMRRKSDDEVSISSNSDTQSVTTSKRTADSESGEDMKKVKLEIDVTPKKKSVKFPDSQDKLCKIILFERAPEEYEFLSDGSAARDSYLHNDVGEASMAFGHDDDYEELVEPVYYKPWGTLQKIEGLQGIERPEGNDSEEKIIQQQRERTVLSENYYSLAVTPASPHEFDVDEVSDDSFSGKIIPIRANEAILKHSVTIKSTSAPSLVVPTDLLNNFMTSNYNYKSMMNPFVTVPAENSFAPISKHFEVPPLKASASIPAYWNAYRPEKTSSSSDSFEQRGGYSSRTICRHYRPGQRNSCRLGSSCRFLHQN